MKRAILTLASALILAACNPLDSRIDASTAETYQKSLQSIRSRLKPEELKKFEEALVIVVMNDIVPKDSGLLGLLAAAGKPDQLQGQMLAVVNGKSPRQILEAASSIRRARALDELKTVNEELATLQKRKDGAAAAAAVLGKIEVANAKYSIQRDSFMSQPIIEFTVKNGTPVALARVYYHGTLSTPGRTVPWIDEDFNNEVAGGIEPGETKQLRLQPNMFSKWGERSSENRADAVLVVKVVNAEGVDKNKLAETFDKSNAERLEILTKQKAELEKTLAAAG